MQDLSKKISILMNIETIAIGALIVVSAWRTHLDMEIDHTALMQNSAAKLLHQVKDAKFLLVSYSVGRTPTLKEWCNDSGQDLSLEIGSPWWRQDKPMFASDNPAQWKKMRQLSEPITAALANPDTLSGNVELKAKLDALESELRAVLVKEGDAWEASFKTKPYLGLAQWALQILIVVAFGILMRSVKTLIKNQSVSGKTE